ncbi:NAD(P)H-dependent glycerol-3-phosphate dehydrogenase [Rhodoplanes serenus]|uniref:NAD(P)H-dependent glycerol-3-phosphate dehydrogenase n=1 Tax=Rhodoplanes serenus TaxID=200615 RepID=UPI000DAEFDF2|nr:NAD(P)H-dependent glycerol-3-phosphate dehydrogenase [Rhodoplanes serenus]RAI37135.1 glycerol-3-phosphate dehydrogenase [Rhodoplanes serenus]
MTYQSIAVVGAGAWGAALANVAARAGRDVVLVARDTETAAAIREAGASPHLPDVALDSAIRVAAGPAAVADADAVLLVVPAQAHGAVAASLAGAVRPGVPVVACAKGIERGSHRFMTEVVAAALPQARPAILSGPSFASDVARGLPTAVTLAAADDAVATALAHSLGTTTLRPYHSTDVRGVEIGGAAKNVLAIAVGIVRGRRLGASAAAALTTRGFAELMRFGRAYGARIETLTGLSGLGDLVLTCASRQSRNFSFGIAIGEGLSPDAARRGGLLAEGAFTAPVLVEMARERAVDMPIATAVAAVLDGRLSVDQAIEALTTRPFRAEH